MTNEMTSFMDWIEADPEQQDEAWRITDDKSADWAVRKIKEEQETYARLNKLAHDQIAEINMRIEDEERRMESKTSYLKAKLAEYFRTVPHKETKTQSQYKLLSGSLVMTKAKETMEKDDDTLLEWLRKSGNLDMIEVKERPMWGEFKKRLTIVDGEVVDTLTGEKVECVTVGTKEASFDVK